MWRGNDDGDDGGGGDALNASRANTTIRSGNAVLVLVNAVSMGLQDWHKATEGASFGIGHGGQSKQTTSLGNR